MKQVKTQDLKPLEAVEMKQLCKTTNETQLTTSQLKKFSAVDLWSIHKARKSTIVRSSTCL